MKKENRVKKNTDFYNIIQNGKKYYTKIFNIYINDSKIDTYRFGISVNKKIGNAVIRNKVKRQLRQIIHQNKKYYQINKDYIIIVKNSYLNYDFSSINQIFVELFKNISN